MDCAHFENELVELLADPEAADRNGRLASLERHADGCPVCAASRGWLEWLAAGPGRGDDVPDPGPRYWQDFDRRLRERIAREAAPARGPRRRLYALAASFVLIALLGGWWLGREARVSQGPAAARGRSDGRVVPDEPAAGEDPWSAFALDLTDEAQVAAASEDSSAYDGWLLPSTAGLDERGRRELLRWLREREAALAGGRV